MAWIMQRLMWRKKCEGYESEEKVIKMSENFEEVQEYARERGGDCFEAKRETIENLFELKWSEVKTRHTCLFKVKFVTSRGTEQHEYQCALLLFVAKILRKKTLFY